MSADPDMIGRCRALADAMRRSALAMAHRAGNNGAHLGGGLSIIEIMATLYGGVMKSQPGNPRWEGRDRFILSKGHGTLGYYTALAAAGIITEEQLFTFEQNGGVLPGQPSLNLDIGVEYSSGSLGMGLSYGVGMGLALVRRTSASRVFVLLGDGECNEGAVWEAAMAARHYKLSNLMVIVDFNCMQSDGTTCEVLEADLAAVWRGFGWDVVRVDGHDIGQLYGAFTAAPVPGTPRVILAKTTKGKGVSFMENNNEWHHNRLTKAQFDAAMAELPPAGTD